MESTLTQDSSVGNNFGNCPRGYSQNTTEEMEAIGKQFLDPRTSPDSEVINLIQDVSIGRDAVLTVTQAVEPAESAASNMELMSLRKQNKSRKVKGTPDSLVASFAAKEKLLGQGKQNKPKKSAKHRGEEKIGSCGHSPNISSLESIRDDPKNSTQRHTLELTKPGIHGGLLKVKINNGCSEFSGEHVGIESSQLLSTNEFSMGLKPSSKPGVESREQKSGVPFPARNRRKNACELKKEGINKSLDKRKVKEKGSLSQGISCGQSHQEEGGDISITSETVDQSKLRGAPELIKDNIMGLEIPSDTGIYAARNFTSEDLSQLTLLLSSLDGQLLPTQNAWVCCDDCCKWRCISTTLADSIEATNCRWTCKDNMDKAFADCSIPQEKSNAEINADLEISEASGEKNASYENSVSKGFEVKPLTVPQQAPWRPIQSNFFLHRNRKANTIDEIMVCQCKPPKEGGLGCGDGCLNRVLNIECVRGTCPCGDYCSNQRFQKRNYSKLGSFRCGKKGYGLQLLENVSRGDFLIEYVGEVLDLDAYEARQREYASRGQKHFYFMTLNGSEVIDACAKGNLGRFINHSCDPNCSTEKWIVNGEVCIGLFAIRNIEKGEEVTFDYNYVRVSGAAAKKCVCGSVKCRGYIGGDPLTSDEIVQGDSDEEFPEPLMVNGECEIEEVKGRITSNTILSDVAQSQNPGQIVLSTSSIKLFGNSSDAEESKRQSGHGVEPIELPVPMEDTTNKSQFAFQLPKMSIQTEVRNKSSFSLLPLEVSFPKDVTNQLLEDSLTILDPPLSKSLPDHLTANKNLISNTIKDRPTMLKERSRTKSFRSSSSIKKVRRRSNLVNGSKLQALENKPKKMLEVLLIIVPEEDAIIYLKLLIVTASSGDNGEALQSTKNLSIILDALLKTKKRNILNDVIRKNGLQMLHNILKHNRTNHKRIPIIRKLLKILEYLAEKEILTLELINSGPHCSGKE
ncbi:Histone-lysine n-methyltransferase ashh2, partial [Thalictrum thalictroides]